MLTHWGTALVLALSGVVFTRLTCPGCVDRGRANSRCEWTGDTAFRVNAAIGLWFSQSIFQLVKPDPRFPDQWLLQGFGNGQIALGAIVIAVIFAAGILWWGNRFDKFRRTTIIGIGVLGGLALVTAAGIVNHVAYDAGHAALAAFTRSLAAELDGTGVNVSLYCTGSRGPRIGQNTRSRGVSRLLHRGEGDDVEEQSRPTDQQVDSLIDALHHPRFLVLAEPRR